MCGFEVSQCKDGAILAAASEAGERARVECIRSKPTLKVRKGGHLCGGHCRRQPAPGKIKGSDSGCHDAGISTGAALT